MSTLCLWIQVYALGFVSVFEQVLDALPADRDAVFTAYVNALDEDPAQYRSAFVSPPTDCHPAVLQCPCCSSFESMICKRGLLCLALLTASTCSNCQQKSSECKRQASCSLNA